MFPLSGADFGFGAECRCPGVMRQMARRPPKSAPQPKPAAEKHNIAQIRPLSSHVRLEQTSGPPWTIPLVGIL